MTSPLSMRSNELAELAGVTVRTLRHYHQIGLLDEPERSVNGYRRYTVRHLATVLRIGSFTDLGVPLVDVREVINDTAAALDLLERLDQQAAADIERLSARRRTIAQLQEGGAAPDLPLALVPHSALLRARDRMVPRDDIHDREQLALLRHFSGEQGMPWLVEALTNLSGSAARYVSLMDAFTGLSENASPLEAETLIDEIVELITSAVPLHDIPALESDATVLLLTHQDDHYNAAQRLVWARVLETLVARTDPRNSRAIPDD